MPTKKSSRTKPNNKKVLFGVGLVLVALIAIGLVLSSSQNGSHNANAPLHPIWVDLNREIDLAEKHSIAAVSEAATKMRSLINSSGVNWESCPDVRMYAEVRVLTERQSDILIGVVPQGVGSDIDGHPGVMESILIDPYYWNQISKGEKWTFIWHEMEHVRQDCEILQAVLNETDLESQGQWDEFYQRWQEAAAEYEALPLAVQGYWQQNGYPIQDFVSLNQLLTRVPGAWSKPLPLDEKGIPMGIKTQSEWTEWLRVVDEVYVVR